MAQPDYQSLARQFAQRSGIDPNAFVRQIAAESNFNPNVTSSAGARGIAQIMPDTARGWGVNPNDPVAALRAAALHMAAYQRQTGSLKGALEMYNLGHTAPDNQLPAETRNYVSKVLGGGPSQVSGSSQVSRQGNTRAQIALALLGFGRSDSLDPLTQALQGAVASPQGPPATPSQPHGQLQNPSETRGIVDLGHVAQRMGLHVGENPAFGGVSPVHAPNSYHYQGRAVDVSGSPQQMAAYAHTLAQQYGPHLAELIYSGPGAVAIKNGQQVNGPSVYGSVWGAHAGHVHVAM
jgi:hypothetical protein